MTTPTSAIEVFDPMDPATLKDPFAAYRELREHHPVALLEPLGLWVVSRNADVRKVLGAPEAFSAALAFGKDSVFEDVRHAPPRRISLRFAGDAGSVVSSSDGADHLRLRRMIAGLLSKPRLDAVEAVVAEYVRKLIIDLGAGDGCFDVVAELAQPVAARAIGEVMGFGDSEFGAAAVRALASWVETTFRALDPGDGLSAAEAEPSLMRGNLKCFRAVTAFLNAAVRQPPSTPLSALVEAWRLSGTPAAREEIILSVLQLFQAGYETIVSGVCSLLTMVVIGRPELSAAGSDTEVSQIIDEVLRLASPVRATVRTVVGPRVVGGTAVPDGATLLLLLGSANRDERVFGPDPDAFLPGRVGQHVAFGGGPHRCLGRYLAHMELRHVLAAVVGAARRVEACDGARLSANFLKAGYERLPVRAVWR